MTPIDNVISVVTISFIIWMVYEAFTAPPKETYHDEYVSVNKEERNIDAKKS
jgi:hypothetical protein